MACQRTVPVRVIRAAIEPCIAPRLGPNVLLAGKPRLIAKLHRPRPGGVPPARANSSLVPGGVETTTTAFATPSDEDVDASPSQAEGRLFGPSAVLRTVWTSPGEAGASPPLAHTRRSRAHILTASATTIHENGDGTDSNRFPDCSVIPGNPSTEQTGELPWGFHETKRETTPAPAGDVSANVLRDKVGSVFNECAVVEGHELETRRNLLPAQERTQQRTGRALDEHLDFVVGGSCGAQTYSHVRWTSHAPRRRSTRKRGARLLTARRNLPTALPPMPVSFPAERFHGLAQRPPATATGDGHRA